MRPTGSIDLIVVAIPAHNEGGRIASCLDHVDGAARRWGGPVMTVIAADACADETVSEATSFRPSAMSVDVIAGTWRRASPARRAAVERALEMVGDGMGRERIWIANTDADSAVPRGWLLEHLRLAAGGADVVLGTVRPDDLDDDREAAWDELHADQAARMEVHGANLGVRADFYRSAQGFPALAEHEDVAFVTDCGELGAMVVSTDGCEVATSGRQTGRTPGGFARYLRDDLIPDPAR